MSIKLVWRGSDSTDTRRIAMPASNFDVLKKIVCEKFPVEREDFILRYVYVLVQCVHIFSLLGGILAGDI